MEQLFFTVVISIHLLAVLRLALATVQGIVTIFFIGLMEIEGKYVSFRKCITVYQGFIGHSDF